MIPPDSSIYLATTLHKKIPLAIDMTGTKNPARNLWLFSKCATSNSKNAYNNPTINATNSEIKSKNNVSNIVKNGTSINDTSKFAQTTTTILLQNTKR